MISHAKNNMTAWFGKLSKALCLLKEVFKNKTLMAALITSSALAMKRRPKNTNLRTTLGKRFWPQVINDKGKAHVLRAHRIDRNQRVLEQLEDVDFSQAWSFIDSIQKTPNRVLNGSALANLRKSLKWCSVLMPVANTTEILCQIKDGEFDCVKELRLLQEKADNDDAALPAPADPPTRSGPASDEGENSPNGSTPVDPEISRTINDRIANKLWVLEESNSSCTRISTRCLNSRPKCLKTLERRVLRSHARETIPEVRGTHRKNDRTWVDVVQGPSKGSIHTLHASRSAPKR